MQTASYSVLILWICLLQTAIGDYDVSVKLLEYNRDEDCSCDQLAMVRCHECDVYFKTCLLPLSPTQRQVCYGNNQDDRVNDTNHFLFADTPWGQNAYTWSNIIGQPVFEILIYVFDYGDIVSTLGVTNYTYQSNKPTVQNVTTSPDYMNMSIELTLTVSCFCIEQGNMTTESTSPKSTLQTDTIFKTRTSNTSFPSTIGTRPSSKSPGSLFKTTQFPSGRTIQHETKRGNVSILVLGHVLSDQLQNLAQQISTLLQKQNQKDVVIQSLDIVFYHNITDQTKIQFVYNCILCNHTDDWVKDKVISALQKLNLTQYLKNAIGENTITDFKINTGMLVGVGVFILLVVIIVISAVCWYKRKLHQKSKIKGVEADQSCHNSKVMINEELPNQQA